MIFRSLLMTDLLPESPLGPERRGMLRAALEPGLAVGLRGSSGLGSAVLLRVNI
jgi:hypothetical protein